MSGTLELELRGAEVLQPDGALVSAPLSISDGRIVDAPGGRVVDLSGFLVLPGIVDAHGDGFERHVAPRRGAMPDMGEGIAAAEAECAANGITTAVFAQFISWEGGLRGPDFADRVFRAIADVRGRLVSDLIAQARFEINLLEEYAALEGNLARWGVDYVVFNDHLPHERLAAGKTPPRLVGQALQAGRSPESHLAFLQGLHAQSAEVPQALDTLCAALLGKGVRLGSHDDRSAESRMAWRARGARIAEFPETCAAAEAARAAGDAIILGAPNLVRGGSHKGNASARELIAQGLGDALASDYHYPSPRRAAIHLATVAGMSWGAAWGLVSSGPARLLGLTDRGLLAPGMRADLVVLERDTLRVAATIAGGRFSYLSGEAGARFVG